MDGVRAGPLEWSVLLGSRPELKNGAEAVINRGRFLNRLLSSGTCYKYMGCASGLDAA